MLIFSVVIFVLSTLTLSPRPPLPRKVGGHDPPAPMGAPPLFADRDQPTYCIYDELPPTLSTFPRPLSHFLTFHQVDLSPSSIIWCRLIGGDALRLGR